MSDQTQSPGPTDPEFRRENTEHDATRTVAEENRTGAGAGLGEPSTFEPEETPGPVHDDEPER